MNNEQTARELLTAARARIEAGSDTFICLAIHKLAYRTYDDRPLDASHALRSWINEMLMPYGAYETWIGHHHRHLMHKVPLHERQMKLRAGRVAWIDWMLTQDLGKIVRKYKV